MMVSLDTMRYKYPGVHVYENMVLPAAFPAHRIDAAKTYQFHEDDVIVATYPKSGTTWMQEIVWLLQNNCDFQKAKATLLEDRCFYLDRSPQDDAARQQEMSLTSPKIIKTHLPIKILNDALDRVNPKVIIVLRNPKDVLVSEFHFYQMSCDFGAFRGSWDEFFEMFKNKELFFGFWFDHVLGWLKKMGLPNYHFVKYEDLKKRPLETISEIARFLQVSLSQKQLEEVVFNTKFDQIKDNKMVNREQVDWFDQTVSKFMRKGIVGDWKNYFSQEQSNYVDGLCAQLEVHGLELDFDENVDDHSF